MHLENQGVVFSGLSPDGKLPEIIELPDHPWFVAVQFHPELKSRPFNPHPLFVSYILAAREKVGWSEDYIACMIFKKLEIIPKSLLSCRNEGRKN